MSAAEGARAGITAQPWERGSGRTATPYPVRGRVGRQQPATGLERGIARQTGSWNTRHDERQAG